MGITVDDALAILDEVQAVVDGTHPNPERMKPLIFALVQEYAPEWARACEFEWASMADGSVSQWLN